MKQVFRVKEVAKMLSVSTSTIWRWTNQGVFPKPKRLGRRVTVWDKNQVEAFNKSQLT